jgi:general secretion pathway protein B
MSYILDALRRAEVERQRGTVPALHAVHEGSAANAAAAGRHRVLRPVGLAIAGVLLLLAVVVADRLIGRRGAAAVPAAVIAPIGAAAPASTTHAGGVAAPAIDPPVAMARGSASPVAAPAVALPVPPAAPLGRAKPRDLAPDRAGSSTAIPASGPLSRPASGAGAAVEPIPRLADLPEDFRRQLPAIALGGGMYSEQAAQRLVIVNGSVAREGDQPAADLRVVQIRPRTVVFSFRGQLFEINL